MDSGIAGPGIAKTRAWRVFRGCAAAAGELGIVVQYEACPVSDVGDTRERRGMPHSKYTVQKAIYATRQDRDNCAHREIKSIAYVKRWQGKEMVSSAAERNVQIKARVYCVPEEDRCSCNIKL